MKKWLGVKPKQSPICLIETFEVVNGIEPASKLFSGFPVGVIQQILWANGYDEQ